MFCNDKNDDSSAMIFPLVTNKTYIHINLVKGELLLEFFKFRIHLLIAKILLFI